MGAIRLKQVAKRFGDVEVIPPLDLEIDDGEFVVFVGPSGCGKSTLLRLIAGLEDVTGGTIEIDGRDATAVAPARRGLAMVFQSYALYPHMTVYKNIAFPLKMAGINSETIDRKVRDAAKVLNLTEYLDRRPGQLSGGQRQRVALMRALMLDPPALLLDEPLGALDPLVRHELQEELREIFRRLGKTVVMVTHDLAEAAFFGSRLVLMRSGRIVQDGSLEDFRRAPADGFVREFLAAHRNLPGAAS